MRHNHPTRTQQLLDAAVTVGLLSVASASAQTIQRIGLGKNNVDPVYWNDHAELTPDGQYIVFTIAAGNLSDSITQGNALSTFDFDSILRQNLQTGDVERVSVDSRGNANNEESGFASISNDGKRIVFAAKGARLEDMYFIFDLGQTPLSVTGDPGWDIFMRDLSVDPPQTRLISFGLKTDPIENQIQVSANGVSRVPQISGDGQHIVYTTLATNLSPNDTDTVWDIYAYDWNSDPKKSKNILISARTDPMGNVVKANSWSLFPSMSDDGRFIVFESTATNLVDNADNNWSFDIFLHDRDTVADGVFDEPNATSTTLISHTSENTTGNRGSFFPAISGNGDWIAFVSWASDLIDGDTNDEPDVFLVERATGVVNRISVSTSGGESNGPSGYYNSHNSTRLAISHDGRYVSFASLASNLIAKDVNGSWDIFVHQQPNSDPSDLSTIRQAATWRASILSDGSSSKLSNVVSSLAVDPTTGEVIVAFQSWNTGHTPKDKTESFDQQNIFVRRFLPTTH